MDNSIGEYTIKQLSQIQFLVTNAKGFSNPIIYDDDFFKLTIEHGHDKDLIIQLIKGSIKNLKDFSGFISCGFNGDTTLIDHPEYKLILKFKEV